MTDYKIQHLRNAFQLFRQHIKETSQINRVTYDTFYDNFNVLESRIVLLHRNLDYIEESLEKIFKEHELC